MPHLICEDEDNGGERHIDTDRSNLQDNRPDANDLSISYRPLILQD